MPKSTNLDVLKAVIKSISYYISRGNLPGLKMVSIQDTFSAKIIKVLTPVSYLVLNECILESQVTKLETELTHYLNFFDEDDGKHSFSIDDFVAVPAYEEDKFVRGLIQNKYNEKKLTHFIVWLLDYGEKFNVHPSSRMRKLPEDFITNLPFRTVNISLPGLYPVESCHSKDEDAHLSKLCTDWNESAYLFCQNLVAENKYFVKVEVKKLISPCLYEGQLRFSNKLFLNEILINEELALESNTESRGPRGEIHNHKRLSNGPTHNVNEIINDTSKENFNSNHQQEDKVIMDVSECPKAKTKSNLDKLLKRRKLKELGNDVSTDSTFSNVSSDDLEVINQSNPPEAENHSDDIVILSDSADEFIIVSSEEKNYVEPPKDKPASPFEFVNCARSPKSALTNDDYKCNNRDVFTFGLAPPKPWDTLEMAYFDPGLKDRMVKLNYTAPLAIQKNCWFPIYRGRDNALIGAKRSGKSMGYIFPILSFLMKPITKSSAGNGPIALILCDSFESVSQIKQLCYQFVTSYIRVIGLTTYTLSPEEQAILINGCEILIAIPEALNSVLFGPNKQTDLIRLQYLILEDGDTILESDIKRRGLNNIIKLKADSGKRKEDRLTKNILCSKTITPRVLDWISKFMDKPLVHISDLEEAAIFTKVHFNIKDCLFCNKEQTLLGILHQLTNDKIVVFALTESIDRLKYVLERDGFCVLRATSDMKKSQLIDLSGNWERNYDCKVILLIDDISYAEVEIYDARHIVHFDFPPEVILYRQRYSALLKNMETAIKNHTGNIKTPVNADCTSNVIMTERNSAQAKRFVELLKRFQQILIPSLIEQISQIHNLKTNDPLLPICTNQKLFGECQQKSCGNRHVFYNHFDAPNFREDREVKMKIIKVKNVNHYYAHLTKYLNDPDEDLLAPYTLFLIKLQTYFSQLSNQIELESPQVGMLAAMKNDNDSFSRVKILSIKPDSTALVWNLETAEETQLLHSRLYSLPLGFTHLKPQAVEVVLANLRPLDQSFSWQPKIMKYVSDLIFLSDCESKIIKALGNTIWIDSLKRLKVFPSLKLSSVDFELAEKLLKETLAVKNDTHMKRLEVLDHVSQGVNKIESVIEAANGRDIAPCDVTKMQNDSQAATCSNSIADSLSSSLTSSSTANGMDNAACDITNVQNNSQAATCSNSVADSLSSSLTSSSVSDIESLPPITQPEIKPCSSHGSIELTQSPLPPSKMFRPGLAGIMSLSAEKRLATKPKIYNEDLDLKTLNEVKVLCINHPYLIYVQRVEMGERLKSLENEINSSVLQEMEFSRVKVGEFCLVKSEKDGRYIRSQVMRRLPSNEVILFSVDDGRRSRVSVNDLRVMEDEFLCKLPLQAISCSLAGIKPLLGDTWDLASSTELSKMCRVDNTLTQFKLKVVRSVSTMAYDEARYEVVLYDELKDIIVNNKLLEKKVAINQPGFAEFSRSDFIDDIETSNSQINNVILPDENSKPKENAPVPLSVLIQKRRVRRPVTGTWDKPEDETRTSTSKMPSTCAQAHIITATSIWYQTESEVVIKIMLSNIKQYDVNVTDQRVEIKCRTDRRNYVNIFDLYSKVDPNPLKRTETLYGIQLIIRLLKTNHVEWPYLLESGDKVPWLKYDVEKIEVSETENSSMPGVFPVSTGIRFESYQKCISPDDTPVNSEDSDSDDTI